MMADLGGHLLRDPSKSSIPIPSPHYKNWNALSVIETKTPKKIKKIQTPCQRDWN
jgi:hypothetical protein